MHLAVESGHAELAVALIEAGADRHRTDPDGKRAEEIDGVGGTESKKVREYSASLSFSCWCHSLTSFKVVQRCGPLDE